jgi:hypothetical protein
LGEGRRESSHLSFLPTTHSHLRTLSNAYRMEEKTHIPVVEPMLLSLPVELIVQILDLASPSGKRNKALLDYMVVCKGFAGSSQLSLAPFPRRR